MVLLIAPVAMADAITQELSGCAGGNVAAALNRTVTVDGESHTISEYIVKEGSGNGILIAHIAEIVVSRRANGKHCNQHHTGKKNG